VQRIILLVSVYALSAASIAHLHTLLPPRQEQIKKEVGTTEVARLEVADKLATIISTWQLVASYSTSLTCKHVQAI
jgi:hypothetical protein